MTNGGQRPDPLGFRIENEMDLLFGRAHPNPTREGCPPRDLLCHSHAESRSAIRPTSIREVLAVLQELRTSRPMPPSLRRR